VLNMIEIKCTVDLEGYVNNFAIVGDIESSISITVDNFDTLNFDCYRIEDNNLVWDEERYQQKITISPK